MEWSGASGIGIAPAGLDMDLDTSFIIWVCHIFPWVAGGGVQLIDLIS